MFKDFNYLKAAIGFIVGFSIIFAFCGKNKDTEGTATNTGSGGMKGNITVSYLQQSNWQINYFNDSGREETDHFAGYQLDFNSDGTVNATKQGASVTGKWSYEREDNQYKLYLNFEPAPFNELNNDWEIIHSNTSKIRLQDLSDGKGGSDYLTLESI
jgi:hypothetical protein